MRERRKAYVGVIASRGDWSREVNENCKRESENPNTRRLFLFASGSYLRGPTDHNNTTQKCHVTEKDAQAGIPGIPISILHHRDELTLTPARTASKASCSSTRGPLEYVPPEDLVCIVFAGSSTANHHGQAPLSSSLTD